MSFFLRKEAVRWFSNISKKKGILKTEFDLYYLCMTLGLAKGQSSPIGDAKEIVQNFVSDYEQTKRLVGATAFSAELNYFGISIDDKSDVQKQICDHFSANNANYLTDSAIKRMNEYASGGYDIITQRMEKPHHVEYFLMNYYKLLDLILSESEDWN